MFLAFSWFVGFIYRHWIRLWWVRVSLLYSHPHIYSIQILSFQDLLSPVNFNQLIHNCGHADNLLALFDGSPVHWSHSFSMIISIRLWLWVSCWNWREGAAVGGWECVSVYVRQCSRCTLCVFTAERVTIINQPTLWNWTQTSILLSLCSPPSSEQLVVHLTSICMDKNI